MEELDAPGRGSSASDVSSEVTTAEVLAEVDRRLKARRSTDESLSQVVVLADRFVFWLAKHWLAVLSALAFLYVGLPVLAPVLMYVGFEWAGRLIYTIYRPLCHQLPQRSFFLFGPQFTYRLEELAAWLGPDAGVGLVARAFVGNEALGYKVGLCQRDIAIYGTILLAGLLYGLARRWWEVPSLPVWAYIVFGVLPMLFDGGYQFISYVLPLLWPDGPIVPHETTPVMRVITGALFGLATVWLSYPLIQETMEDVYESLHRRFGWR